MTLTPHWLSFSSPPAMLFLHNVSHDDTNKGWWQTKTLTFAVLAEKKKEENWKCRVGLLEFLFGFQPTSWKQISDSNLFFWVRHVRLALFCPDNFLSVSSCLPNLCHHYKRMKSKLTCPSWYQMMRGQFSAALRAAQTSANSASVFRHWKVLHESWEQPGKEVVKWQGSFKRRLDYRRAAAGAQVH